MRIAANFICAADIQDPGAGLPKPTDRRLSPAEIRTFYEHVIGWAQEAERLGYESIWLNEHHFMYEGYEVLPNIVLMSAILAQHTRTLRFGAAVNVVPQWHPLRLAEDFAIADIMSGGRMIFGCGRGTVAREARSLGSMVGAANGGTGAPVDDADRYNRKQFEEAMAILRLAWTQETFAFEGEIFTFPPRDVDDRGSTVAALTLVPKPLCYPELPEIWLATGSEQTIVYGAEQGLNAVFGGGWVQKDEILGAWQRWTELAQNARGRSMRPGEGKMLVHDIWIADSYQQALREARPSHDETKKWLAPYGRWTHYRHADGSRFQFGEIPTLEQSIAQGFLWAGSPEDVAEQILAFCDGLGLEFLDVFVQQPGMTDEQVREQMGRFMTQVYPLIEGKLGATPLVASAAD